VFGLLAYHVACAVRPVHLALQVVLCPPHRWLPHIVLRSRAFAEVSRTSRAVSQSCHICLETFEDDDAVTPLLCGHVFHENCISEWLRRSNVCPLRCEDHVLHLSTAERKQSLPPMQPMQLGHILV